MLKDSQRAALEAFCDTIVPRIERPDDPDGFWARSASDLMIAGAVEQLIAGIPDEVTRGGLVQLLGAIAGQGIARAPSQESREQILRNLSYASPAAAAGINALTGMTLFMYYGAPDPQTGTNPNWATLGYPGPPGPPQQVPKAIQTIVPDDGQAIEADAVVVGSGAGGSVIAATLAAQGRKVVVLEAAGYFNESDFAGFELPAYQSMFWRGGPTPTADLNVSLQAGTTLGGGTTINWTNCLRTKSWVREEWARDHGLEGVDGTDYDRHLDAVLARLGATDKASDLNGPQQRMKEGADKLGWHFSKVVRNADLDRYSYETAGHLGFGDGSGSKLSAEKTWLRDAFERDADFLVRTRAQRILTEDGRAAGVEAVYTGDDGGEARRVTVRAPIVVVACGALESPALLRRSGIGGPAVGDHLRLHPAAGIVGQYGTDQEAWLGAPHTGLVDEFAGVRDGYGFLIEGVQYTPGLTGSALPWSSAESHKELIAGARRGATFITLTRDRGHGRVDVDANGESVPYYSVTDPVDVANVHHGAEAAVRLHVAAGAQQVAYLAGGLPLWRAGDDLDAFLEQIRRVPLRAGGVRLFSAHQMGTCRMGTDPATSVAGPWGELHDVKGVWVGDGSAFPTSSGTNPMISIMALARRTAEAIVGAAVDGELVDSGQRTGR
jgi:choline dehydrogenase-like flavoprotein